MENLAASVREKSGRIAVGAGFGISIFSVAESFLVANAPLGTDLPPLWMAPAAGMVTGALITNTETGEKRMNRTVAASVGYAAGMAVETGARFLSSSQGVDFPPPGIGGAIGSVAATTIMTLQSRRNK